MSDRDVPPAREGASAAWSQPVVTVGRPVSHIATSADGEAYNPYRDLING